MSIFSNCKNSPEKSNTSTRSLPGGRSSKLRTEVSILIRSANKGEKSNNTNNNLIYCERGDLNPHGLLHYHLKVARIPIPPLPQNRWSKRSYQGASFYSREL